MMRRFIYCLAVFALGTASAAPLIVPPKQMQPAPILPIIQQQLAAHGAEMLAIYRVGTGRGYFLQVQRYAARGMNADERGVRAISAMLNSAPSSAQPSPAASPCDTKTTNCSRVYSVRFSGGTFLESRPVTLCGDRLGWLDKVSMRSGAYSVILTQVFARSGDQMYEATLNYPADAGDPIGAEASLLTLCPPMPSETPQPQPSPAVVQAPQGWVSGVNAPPQSDDTAQYTARWLKLGPNTHTLEFEYVVQKTQTDNHTAEEQSDLLRATDGLDNVERLQSSGRTLCEGRQGWFSSEKGVFSDGHSYVVESMVANARGTWYGVVYTRRAEDPEDSQARAALDSVCPAS